MNKKLLVISVLLIAVVLLFAACNSKDKEGNTTTAEAVLSTNAVPVISEYSTTKSGEKFVTNKNGETIPATTDKDGNVELPEDLITKTAEQVSKEAEAIKNPSSKPVQTTQSNSGQGNGSGIVIGNEDPLNNEGNMAVIDWR